MTAHPVTLEGVETENGLEVSSVSAACPPASGPQNSPFQGGGPVVAGLPQGSAGSWSYARTGQDLQEGRSREAGTAQGNCSQE